MKTVLVVDDDPDILYILKRRLVLNGFTVITSGSCDEGLKIFYILKPDLVLLDINVGTADGREMCGIIKSQAAYKHIPVVLASANCNMLSGWQAHGAYAAVEKPFNFSRLLEVLQKASV